VVTRSGAEKTRVGTEVSTFHVWVGSVSEQSAGVYIESPRAMRDVDDTFFETLALTELAKFTQIPYNQIRTHFRCWYVSRGVVHHCVAFERLTKS